VVLRVSDEDGGMRVTYSNFFKMSSVTYQNITWPAIIALLHRYLRVYRVCFFITFNIFFVSLSYLCGVRFTVTKQEVDHGIQQPRRNHR
jgi:hypothetical protein